MASKLGQLTIGIAADLASLKRDMGQAKTVVSKSMNQISRSARTARNSLAGIAAGIISARGLQALVRYSDEYTNLNNRLRLAATSSESFAKSQKLVFDIAQDTRQALGSTAELYQRLALSTRELNLTQTDLGSIVKTVNQSLVISGASSQAASAAIVQLGQGLAAGALRGQEFNSIAEQAPRLMQALADSLGVNIGKLREYSKEGKLTAKVIVDALKGQSQVIAKEFNETQLTVDQSLQKIQNSFTKLFGEGLQGAGATRELTGALEDFNKLINDPAIAGALVTLASAVIKAAAAFVSLTANTTTFFKGIAEDFARFNNGAADVSGAIKEIDAAFSRNRFNGFFDEKTFDKNKNLIQGLSGFSSVEELDAELSRIKELVLEVGDIRDQGIGSASVRAAIDQQFEALLEIEAILEKARDARPAVVTPKKTKDELIKDPPVIDPVDDKAAKKALQEIERQVSAIKSAIKSAQPPLKTFLDSQATAKSLLQAQKISLTDYNNVMAVYQERLDKATGANEQWNKDLADSADFAASAKTEIEKLEEELEKLYSLAERQPNLISSETVKRNAEEIKKQIEEIKEESDKAGKATKDIGAALAQGMQDVVSDGFVSIWKGGFDEVLAGFGDLLINLALEAAAADVVAALGFGGKDNTGGNLSSLANALFSFEGGGFTGSGSRSGGIDGRGGFLSVLHPNETVLDHTKGQSMGGTTNNITFVASNNRQENDRALGQLQRRVTQTNAAGARMT